MRRAILGLLVGLTIGNAAPAGADALPPVVLKPWAMFTNHLYEGELGEPRGIAIDGKTGDVWVADTRTQVLGLFSPEGIPLFTSAPSRNVREPSRMVVDRRGRLFVLDNDRSRIKILSYRGEYAGDLALPNLPAHRVFGTLAMDAAGNLYVGENESGQVLVYGPDLKPRLRFGSAGTEDGQFQAIAGIAADAELIFVVDQQSTPVQAFDHRGNLVRAWGRHDMGAENFSLPQAVALDSKGRVIVVDALRHEIKLFDREGHFLDRFGGFGSAIGQIAFPVDVAVDAKDRIYVAERGNSRVQVFVEAPPSPARLR